MSLDHRKVMPTKFEVRLLMDDIAAVLGVPHVPLRTSIGKRSAAGCSSTVVKPALELCSRAG